MDYKKHSETFTAVLESQIMDAEIKRAYLLYKIAKLADTNADAKTQESMKQQYQLKVDQVEMELENLQDYYQFLTETYNEKIK